MKIAFLAVALTLALGTAAPALAQMDSPEWIEDVKWRATLGTGVAVETGGTEPQDPVLLYFGGDVRKAWRWWYGLTFYADADFFTGLVDCPMVPYKLLGTTGLSLGPRVFRMEVARARVRTEFGGVCMGYSTGTNFRMEASTLPTFSGDVPITDQHILSYTVAPLQIAIGHYNETVQPGIGEFNLRPYTAGTLYLGERFIVNEWLQLHGGMDFFKAWSNLDFQWTIDMGVVLGILENAVQFGLDLYYLHWKTPAGYTENTATLTLSARLRI